MAEIIVIGGGVAGLTTGMLLARDGHRVRLLERDAAPPPGGPDEAWATWPRKGVNQFRMIHLFLPKFRHLLEAELPEAVAEMERAGAVRYNLVEAVPETVRGELRDDDAVFTMVTGRRPVVEDALARVAEATPGLEVRRGVAVAGLRTGPADAGGVPHVVGVRTEDGQELDADLVVDASGRRSPLPRWLADVGARPCAEELDDSGFVYYGRHFRSADGSLPPVMAPLLSAYGSISVLTLPADNGTWGVGIVASADDAALRGLRHVDRWEAVMRQLPLVAHWADGEPLDDDVAVMAKIEDRIRGYVVDGVPVATGVAPVGDAWACTNPSVGRGATIGLMHAVALRDLLREQPPDDPAALALAWDAATKATVEPWYRATLHFDRNRLAEVKAAARGEAYDPGDVVWEFTKALQYGASLDGDVLRGFLRLMSLTSSADEVLAEPGFAEKVMAVGGDWRNEPVFGPTRDELVKLAGA